ncbi:MAG: hypothetical protein ABIP33_02585 [Pseudolysinimonas sp.]
MSTATLTPTPVGPTLAELRPTHWHRPLLVLAGVMALLAAGNIVGAIIDPRQVTGADVWLKPLKFALSTGIYSLALAWLIARIPRGTRLARIAGLAGTIAAVGLGVELAIIDGFALVGQTSHFNVSTPFHTAMWAVMAISIAIVWVVTLVIGIALFRVSLGDAARTVGIRAGVVVALIGMALGALMTGPTAAQLNDFQGIAGAHTVGLPDGGPGLPLLGWSTVGGDLRIPHFVGMHALQLLPLLVLLLEILAVRIAALRDPRRRLRVVVLAVAVYGATLSILTVQALSGQSIVAPTGGILVAGIATAVAGIVGLIVLITAPVSAGRRHPVH